MLLEDEVDKLKHFLAKNPKLMSALVIAPHLKMKNWYLGAGCIAQTVWNILHGFSPESNVKDYDLVYFDDSDLSYEAENMFIEQGASLFKGLNVKVEIRNEARVHLWYKDRFGKPLSFLDSSGNVSGTYKSVEDAISAWPTTATSIGVRLGAYGKFEVYAPFGLNDLLGMIVRPNKRGVPREVYIEKVQSWTKHWPNLRVVPWEENG